MPILLPSLEGGACTDEPGSSCASLSPRLERRWYTQLLGLSGFCSHLLEESCPASNLHSGQGHAITAYAQEREPASSAKICKCQMESLRFDLFFSS